MNKNKQYRTSVFDLAALENRLLYCVDGGLGVEFGTFPMVTGPSLSMSGSTTSTGTVAGPVGVSGGVPALSSNPTATAKLYIDFNGAAAQGWGSFSVPATPAYDQDGDATTFSDAELASIKEIWARVAEKYSPFNLDVTTVDPGTYPLGKVMRVVVGGGGAWAGAGYGGISYVGSFTSGPNTSYVFTQNLGNGYPSYTAEAIAHESGHGFGLQHQSSYDLSGNKTAEYSTGNGSTAPILGNSYYATRGLWWYGTSSLGSKTYQDDMAVISGNSFGYRADDHGNSISVADALLVSGDSVSASGIIGKTSDADFFKFMTAGGSVTLAANVLSTGATLDLKLALYSSSGALVATADTANLSESMTLNLGSGTYYLSVMSEGNYGDVGQYTISGSVPAAQGVLPAPSGLVSTMSAASSQVNLSWTDNSASESGFRIQQSNDGGLTWLDVASVGANVTSYQTTEPVAGGSSQFRVYAFDATTTSDFSNAVTVYGPPIAPASVAAKAASTTQVSVSWSLVNSATSYLLQRSTDGVNWMQLATLSGGSYQDGNLSSNVTYYYRVAASSVGGMSSFSAPAAATTMIAQVPAAPSNLVATRISKGKIRLTWLDNSNNESGFRIEYSANGGAWKVLTSKGAGTTTYTAGLHAGTLYSFRVYAYNASGNSAYTAVAQAAAGKTITQTTTVKTVPFSAARIDRSLLTDDPSVLKSKHGKVFKAA